MRISLKIYMEQRLEEQKYKVYIFIDDKEVYNVVNEIPEITHQHVQLWASRARHHSNSILKNLEFGELIR